MDTNRDRVAAPARKVLKSAAVMLALLFVMLRPVCDAFATPGGRQAPGQAEHRAVHMTGVSASGHFDDGTCCASADEQALTARAMAPLPTMSPGIVPAPSTAVSLQLIPLALPMNVLARRDPAPPLPFHARSLRRLD